MSLFQARDWWEAAPGADEDFLSGALVVGNVDNQPGGADKIVTGSLQGVLRVFGPAQQGFRIEDLLLEQQLGQPVLQLLIGNFHPTSGAAALAVLHPRELVVYEVVSSGLGHGGGADGGNGATICRLDRLYGHPLGIDAKHFTAKNMTCGAFGGGSSGKDSICVQSMDGQLAFFEQSKHTFTRQIDTLLLPGPIAYLAKLDCILVASTELTVDAYKYQVLAAASGAAPRTAYRGSQAAAADGDDNAEGGAGAKKPAAASRRVKREWSVNVGEEVLDMTVCRFSHALPAGAYDVLLLTTRGLLCLRETAGGSASAVRMQRRLDTSPLCFTMFDRPAQGGDAASQGFQNLLTVTNTGMMQIYRGRSLIWAAKCSGRPTAVAVGTFGGLAGLVVTLDEGGMVRISYMGTEPPATTVGSLGGEGKDLDYAGMDAEHKRLLGVIRDAQRARAHDEGDRVEAKLQIPRVVEHDDTHPGELAHLVRHDNEAAAAHLRDQAKSGSPGREEELPPVPTVCAKAQLLLQFTGGPDAAASNVTVSLSLPEGVSAPSLTIPIGRLAGGAGEPLSVPIMLRPRRGGMPSDLLIKAAISYTLPGGHPRVARCEAQAPLSLVVQAVPPVKNVAFKLTIDSNRMPPPLADLFPDVLASPATPHSTLQQLAASAPHVISFQYNNGAIATLLASKTGGRYRIQSGSLEAMVLVSRELTRRLRSHAERHELSHIPGDDADPNDDGAGRGGPFAMGYPDTLPLADLFHSIQAHFRGRVELVKRASALNDLAQQYRLVQRRLLVRYRDRNPSPLGGLDRLLAATHDQLMAAAVGVESAQGELRHASNKLSCLVRLLHLLMELRFGLSPEQAKALHAHLPADVTDSLEQGWEERTDASVTHLLRTALVRSGKEAAVVPPPLEMPRDTSKLQKHITTLVDRVAQGGDLAAKPKRSRKGRSGGAAPAAGSGAAAGGGGGGGGGGQ